MELLLNQYSFWRQMILNLILTLNDIQTTDCPSKDRTNGPTSLEQWMLYFHHRETESCDYIPSSNHFAHCHFQQLLISFQLLRRCSEVKAAHSCNGKFCHSSSDSLKQKCDFPTCVVACAVRCFEDIHHFHTFQCDGVFIRMVKILCWRLMKHLKSYFMWSACVTLNKSDLYI